MVGDGPVGLGWDVAGVIDEVGRGVAGLRPGDRVIGLSNRLDVPVAAQAELVVLDADAVARAPRDVDPVAAATLPLNGLTAAQALDMLDLKPGGSVLVTGAVGGEACSGSDFQAQCKIDVRALVFAIPSC